VTERQPNFPLRPASRYKTCRTKSSRRMPKAVIRNFEISSRNEKLGEGHQTQIASWSWLALGPFPCLSFLKLTKLSPITRYYSEIKMEILSNIVNNIISHKDDHGVIDLLETVSRRASSCSEEQRREVGEIVKRLRYKHPKTPTKIVGDTRRDFVKDALQVDLLRGFGPSLEPTEAKNVSMPQSRGSSPPHGELLRHFGESRSKYDSDQGSDGSESGDDSFDGSGFEEPRHL
jgi:hypothetical protein